MHLSQNIVPYSNFSAGRSNNANDPQKIIETLVKDYIIQSAREREDKEKEEKILRALREKCQIHEAIHKISQTLSFVDKYNCISCARKVMQFLAHPVEVVRQFASNALGLIIQVAIAAILKENSPATKSELLMGLQTIVSDLNRLFNSGQIKQEIFAKVSGILTNCQKALNGEFPSELLQNTTGREDDEGSAINKISILLTNTDKYTCISAMKKLIKYLTHSSPAVRKFACDLIVMLLKMATNDLLSEENPSRKNELISGLQSVTTEISGLINKNLIPRDIASRIREALRSCGREISQVNFDKNQKSCDEFTSHLDQVRKNIIGDISFDKFIGHLNQISKNILGNITFDQFVGALDQSRNNVLGNLAKSSLPI